MYTDVTDRVPSQQRFRSQRVSYIAGPVAQREPGHRVHRELLSRRDRKRARAHGPIGGQVQQPVDRQFYPSRNVP